MMMCIARSGLKKKNCCKQYKKKDLLLYFNKVEKNRFKADEEAIKGGKRCHENISVQGSDTTMKPWKTNADYQTN